MFIYYISTFGLRFRKGLFIYNVRDPLCKNISSGIVCVCYSGIVCICYDLHKVLLCKNIYSGIFCMCYDLHIMQIIYLHGHFAPNWKNSNYSKIVIFACNYTRIGMIACNTYQKWYICSMQTITVCAILFIWKLEIHRNLGRLLLQLALRLQFGPN